MATDETTIIDKITRFLVMDDLPLPFLPQELWQKILYFLDEKKEVLYAVNPLFKRISLERRNYAISLDEKKRGTVELMLQIWEVKLQYYEVYVIRECKIRYFEFTPAVPYDCSDVQHMCCCDCDRCDLTPYEVPAIKKYMRDKSKSTTHILFLRKNNLQIHRVKKLLSSGRGEKIMSDKNLSIIIEDIVVVKKHHSAKKPCDLVFDKIPLYFLEL